MSINRLLGGENIKPSNAAQARALIGKQLQWLTEWEIDKSGRGYFFPKTGSIIAVHRREVEIENGNFISISSFVEMKEISHD